MTPYDKALGPYDDKNQELLQLAVAAAKIGFWYVDMTNQQVVFDATMANDWGMPLAAFPVALDTCVARVHPDDQALLKERMHEAQTHLKPYAFEHRVIRPDGDMIWVLIKGGFTANSAGEYTRFAGISIDITERKREELAAQKTAAAVSQERQKLEEVLEHAPVPLALLEGPDQRFAFANSAFRAAFAASSQVIGQSVATAFPEIAEQGYGELLRQVYETGQSYSAKEAFFEWRNQAGRRREFYVDFTLVAKRDPDKAITGVLVALIDVTDKVHARQQVESNEAYLELLFDAMPQMIFLADADGHIIKFNKRWYDYIGAIKGTEGWGWVDTPVHHPDDLQTAINLWQRAIKTGQPYEIEYRLRRFDGSYRWHLGRAQPIQDAQGKIVQWFGTNTDIDDIKAMRDKLVKADDKLDLALVSGNIGFWDWEAKTGYTTLSPTLMQSWGIDPLQFKNTLGECLQCIHPDDRKRVMLEIQEATFAGRKYDIEYRVVRPDGRVLTINAKGQCFVDEHGAPARLSGITIDITQRKKFEKELEEARDEAQRANGAKSAFLANMSHEIRSPLGAIMGFGDLLRTVELSKRELAEFSDAINRNAQHLLRIVDDVLDLSKVEAGKITLEKIEFSLVDLLADFSSAMVYRAAEKGIEFQIHIPSTLPNRVITDPTRLRQILSNVVGNAIKFTDQGQVAVEVTFENDCLDFKVTDTGIGLTEEQQKHLFQAFHQADASTTRRFGGTGLGLILTRKFCEALGGSFSLLQAAPNAGATFVATLRVELPAGYMMVNRSFLAFASQSSSPPPTESQVLAGLKVLIVEDSRDNQILFTKFLKKAGAIVDLVSDGVEALERAFTRDYDLVLMDVQMPRMDGHTATRALRAKGFRAPIIALTAHAMAEEQQRAAAAGFTDFLSKPVLRETLFEMLLKHWSPAKQTSKKDSEG